MTPIHDVLNYVNQLREQEVEYCFARLNVPTGKVLEIGGGTGQQARCLERHFREVVSVDLADSEYSEHRVFQIVDYDGHHLPFPDASFDVVYSSNVLEHIPHLSEFQRELTRVLRPGGRAIHVVPTHSWRFWTTLAYYPALLEKVWGRWVSPHCDESSRFRSADSAASASTRRMPTWMRLMDRRHGERGNFVTEYFYFHPTWWRRHFVKHGWQVEIEFPVGLFYTGHVLRGNALTFEMRRKLARPLGSSTHCFCLSVPEVHTAPSFSSQA